MLQFTSGYDLWGLFKLVKAQTGFSNTGDLHFGIYFLKNKYS